jgi:hypothetical protein
VGTAGGTAGAAAAAGWKIINLNFILQPSTIFPPGCAQQLAGLYAFSFFLKKK